MSPSPFWPCDSAPSKSCQDLILPQPRMCLISCLAVWFSALSCCLSRNTHKHFRHSIKSQLTLSSHTTKTQSIYTVTLKKDKNGEQQTKNTNIHPDFQKLSQKAFPQPFSILKNVDWSAEKLVTNKKSPHWQEPLTHLKILCWLLQGLGNQRAAGF